MEAKPILSTPIMRLRWVGAGQWWADASLGVCVSQARRVFGLSPKARPRAIQLRAFAKPAKGRKLIRLRQGAHGNALWTSSASSTPRAMVEVHLSQWLFANAPFAADLRAGKTVTVHVALEVVEE